MAKVSISNFSAMYIKYKIVGDENAAVTLTITLPFKEKSIVCDLQTVDCTMTFFITRNWILRPPRGTVS